MNIVILHHTALLLILLYLLTIITSLFHGQQNRVNLKHLIQTRFFELLPIRSLFWIILASLGSGLFLKFPLLIIYLERIISQKERTLVIIIETIQTGLIIIIISILIWLIYYFVLRFSTISTIHLKVDQLKIHYGISPRRLTSLGIEKFPNETDPSRNQKRQIRRTIAFTGVVATLLVIGSFIVNEKYQLGINLEQPIQTSLSSEATWLAAIGLTLLITIPTLIVILIFDNRDYTLLSFNATVQIQLGLLLGMVISLFCLGVNIASLLVVAGIILAIYGVRAIADLMIESKYRRVKQVCNPIAETIKNHTPYLDQITSDPQFQLAPLNSEQVAQRITQGCKNVESRSLLVIRNFVRFCNIVEVQYQDVAVAILRYLTVRRYISLSGGSRTRRPLQNPQVPIWTYELFPLNPPAGYVNLSNSLSLPQKWDVVKTCYTCGGRGQVSKTVSETDSDGNTETYTVQETCSACSGSGRLEYTQILHTEWQKLVSLTTDPSIPVTEMVEDAEETICYHLPLTENCKPANQLVVISREDSLLIAKMQKTGQQMKHLHQVHQPEVELFHDGRLTA